MLKKANRRASPSAQDPLRPNRCRADARPDGVSNVRSSSRIHTASIGPLPRLRDRCGHRRGPVRDIRRLRRTRHRITGGARPGPLQVPLPCGGLLPALLLRVAVRPFQTPLITRLQEMCGQTRRTTLACRREIHTPIIPVPPTTSGRTTRSTPAPTVLSSLPPSLRADCDGEYAGTDLPPFPFTIHVPEHSSTMNHSSFSPIPPSPATLQGPSWPSSVRASATPPSSATLHPGLPPSLPTLQAWPPYPLCGTRCSIRPVRGSFLADPAPAGFNTAPSHALRATTLRGCHAGC